jgi:hypothetical protein
VHRGRGGKGRRQQVGGLVNLKGFFVATLSSALELGIAVPDDVLRHVTTDVLSIYLPRPLWARLITACLGAARVDARLVVETVGVPNLCEHVPLHILWACVEEIGHRSLSGVVMAPASAPGSRPVASAPVTASRPIPLATPPPPPASEPRIAVASTTVGPSIPLPGTDGENAAMHGRVPPGQRFRPSTSGVGRLAASTSARRPQAQATPPAPPPTVELAAGRSDAIPRVKRGPTDADFDIETYVGGKDDWKNALAVEDEQLVEWSASDEAAPPSGDDRKR